MGQESDKSEIYNSNENDDIISQDSLSKNSDSENSKEKEDVLDNENDNEKKDEEDKNVLLSDSLNENKNLSYNMQKFINSYELDDLKKNYLNNE